MTKRCSHLRDCRIENVIYFSESGVVMLRQAQHDNFIIS